MRASLVALTVVLGAANAATAAEPIGFLICQPGGPDLTEEQTKVMDRLFRHLEKKLSLAEGQIRGQYANDKKACDKALAAKPAIIFPSVPIFIEKKNALKLEPVAQLRLDGKTHDNFYVMTQADNKISVSDLAGQTVMGTDLGSPRFLSDAVFAGELKAAQLKLKPTKRALKGIRRAASGRVGAVVLSGTQYRSLKTSRYFKKLRLIHTSPPLPTAPVTVVRGRISADFGRRLGKALVGMSADADGRKVLETFQIEGFEATSRQQWAQLEARLSSL